MNLILGDQNLRLEDVVNVARNNYKVELGETSVKRIEKARALVERYVEEGRVCYGITTGFGMFSDVVISKEDTSLL